MSEIQSILLFLVGLFLIIKGADWLTDGAASIARRFNVSSMVIGLTIVAFGTSAPELVVSILSGIEGKSDIAIGNVLGSNLFNTLAIVGITALICPIMCHKSTIKIDLPISILASILLLFFTSDRFLFSSSTDEISRIDGVILFICFIAFILYSLNIARKSESPTVENNTSADNDSLLKPICLFAVGLACLLLGGTWFVDGASDIALMLGVSQSTIAITIVAAGTSFPELVTSVIAARKGDTDMALGNVIGSNIFNIFMILGISSVIRPLEMGGVKPLNIIILVGSSILMYVFGIVGKRYHYITRSEGFVLTIAAIAYYTYIVMDQ